VAFTLNDFDITRARVSIPRYGLWSGDVTTAEQLDLKAGAAVRLVLGDLVLVGVAGPGGTWAGASSYLIRPGAGGWTRELPARAYRNDGGILLSQVATDLAAEAGERLVVEPGADRVVGYAWTRLGGVASAALVELVGSSWWTGIDGVTHVGPRPAVAMAGAALGFTVERFDPQRRRAVLSTDDAALAALCTPGATWSDPRIVGPFITAGALLEVTAGAVRVEVIG
jgi:hypothetical protein